MTEWQVLSKIKQDLISSHAIAEHRLNDSLIRDVIQEVRINLIHLGEEANRTLSGHNSCHQSFDIEFKENEDVGYVYAKVPDIYFYKDGARPSVRYVGPLEGVDGFRVVSRAQENSASKNSNFAGKPYASIHRNEIRIFRCDLSDKFRVEAIFTDTRQTRFYGYDWKKDDIPLYTSSIDSLVALSIEKLGSNLYLIPTTPPNTGTDIPPVEGSANVQQGRRPRGSRSSF